MLKRRGLVVTGTDTEIGKTVFAAALAGALDAYYWKPVQAGLAEATDSETVQRLSGLPPSRILPEAWRLKTPASPHRAAAIDGVELTAAALQPPPLSAPLVIEGAGGLLVPLNRGELYADVFARWQWPTILCARTGLGTINHSLLSIEAMRSRGIPLLGIVYLGAACEDTESVIADLGRVPRLGRLPRLERLDAASLAAAFRAHFDLAPFQRALGL